MLWELLFYLIVNNTNPWFNSQEYGPFPYKKEVVQTTSLEDSIYSLLDNSELDRNMFNNFEIADKLAKLDIYFSKTRDSELVDLFVESYLELASNYDRKIDPFLLYSQIIVESKEYKYAISPLGAGGYLQLMPETAKDLGIKNVYIDENYKKAWKYRREYNKLKSQRNKIKEEITKLAMELNDKNSNKILLNIEKLNQQYDSVNIEAKKAYYSSRDYFRKYKENLLEGIIDSKKHFTKQAQEQALWEFDGRFSDRALYYGMKKMFNDFNHPEINGDERLVLSLYHGGWGNIRNYHKQGNPPEIPTVIKSTQEYQNEIMNLKRKYSSKADSYFLNHKKDPKFYSNYKELRKKYFNKIKK